MNTRGVHQLVAVSHPASSAARTGHSTDPRDDPEATASGSPHPAPSSHGHHSGCLIRLGSAVTAPSGRSLLPKRMLSRLRRRAVSALGADESDAGDDGDCGDKDGGPSGTRASGGRDRQPGGTGHDESRERSHEGDARQHRVTQPATGTSGSPGVAAQMALLLDDGWAREALTQGDDALVDRYAVRLIDARDEIAVGLRRDKAAGELADKITMLVLGQGRPLDVGGLSRARERLIKAHAARRATMPGFLPVSESVAGQMAQMNFRLAPQLHDTTQRSRTLRQVRVAVRRLRLSLLYALTTGSGASR